MSSDPGRTIAAASLIADIGAKYLWWEPVDKEPHSTRRQIAQIMHLGTYADVRRLEGVLSPDQLAEIMINAEPGWFDDRSWAFWRGRLAIESSSNVPVTPPKRRFVDAI